MTLLEVFTELEFTWLGATIRESTWLFPAIEAVHLLGLAALGGAVILVDLRLLGLGVRGLSPMMALAGMITTSLMSKCEVYYG